MSNGTIRLRCGICGNDYDQATIDGIIDNRLYMARCGECLLRIDAEASEREENDRMIQIMKKRSELLEISRIPPSYVDFNFEIGNRNLHSWVSLNSKESLWISGPTGAGKTRAVCAVGACRQIEYNIPVRFWRTSEMCRKLAGLYGDKIREADKMIDEICMVRILILDDLGKEVLTDRQGEILFEIIDRRYESNRQVWVTTNQTGDDLAARLGPDRGAPALRRLREMCQVWT